jgi:hypothetical protein
MDRRVAALAAAGNRNPAAECRATAEATDHGVANREGLTVNRVVMFRSKAVAECLTGHHARTVVAIVVRASPEGPVAVDRVWRRVSVAGQLARTTGRKRAGRRKALTETLPAAGSTATRTLAAPAIDGRPCRVGARNSAIPMDEPSGPIRAVR